MNIIVSDEIASVCPEFVGAAVEASVKNTPFCQELWDEIHLLENRFRDVDHRLAEGYAEYCGYASGV
jgi:hypothetical protein